MNKTIKSIAKAKNIKGNVKIINLYNGADEEIDIERKELDGGSDIQSNFITAWNKLQNDVISNNFNNIKDTYNTFLIAAENFKIHKDEANRMFDNLLHSSNVNIDIDTDDHIPTLWFTSNYI